MSIKEYLQAKLRAFQLPDAYFVDISAMIDLESEVDASNIEEVNKAVIPIIEELVFSPQLRSINENGFSVTWDVSGLAKWYLFLCRKYKVRPNEDVNALLGISQIIDKTDTW